MSINKIEHNSNGVEVRHSINKKAEIYEYFLTTNAKATYGRYGREFKNILHFENYLTDKCKIAYRLIDRCKIAYRDIKPLLDQVKKENHFKRHYIDTVKDCKSLTLEEIKKVVDELPIKTLEGLGRPSLL